MNKTRAIAILQDAAQSEHGILLHASNPLAAVNAFVRARGDRPDLASLEFRQVDLPDANLAIVHGNTNAKVVELAAPKLPHLEDL